MVGTVEAAIRQMRQLRVIYGLSLREVRQELIELKLWDAADRVTQRIQQIDRRFELAMAAKRKYRPKVK